MSSFIISILVITLTTKINGQKISVCPPPDLLHPCYCQKNSPFSPQVIYCGGKTPIDLKAVFTKLATNLTENERNFPFVYINNTAITELTENTFGDIGFASIQIRDSHSLKQLDLDTFKGRTSFVTQNLKFMNTPSLENTNGSLFKAISKLAKLSSLSLYNTNLTELPDNAFQNGNPLLIEVKLSGKSIVSLGGNAFKKSSNFVNLCIVNTSISHIPNEAFVVDNPNTQFMVIYMFANNLITGGSFAPRSLVNINRTAIIFLSVPFARSQNITFLDKSAFLPFLEAYPQNSLMINDRSFNCSDSRNQWLIESKHFSRVHFTHCKPKTNITEEYYTEWQEFKSEFKKSYSDSIEEQKRKHIFVNNLKRINSHNIEFENGLKSYELAVNQFTDMSLDEIRVKTTPGLIKKSYTSYSTFDSSSLNRTVPDHLDWRDKNIVTSVKNQFVEKCGSCWAHTAVATIEGQLALKSGQLMSLSAQNLVDCSSTYGNFGCEGGITDLGFDYIIQNEGIATEESYPYKDVDQDCQFSNKTIGARITGYVDLPPRDEQMLKKAVALIGPIAVRLEATGFDFYNYKTGVYINELCSQEAQDATHAVTVVGYGTTPEGQDYWLIKNSFGTEWGEKGYIRWARNRNNMCGVATSPSYPTGVH